MHADCIFILWHYLPLVWPVGSFHHCCCILRWVCIVLLAKSGRSARISFRVFLIGLGVRWRARLDMIFAETSVRT